MSELAVAGVRDTHDVLAVRDLRIVYRERQILTDASLSLQSGDFAVCTGPNGGGKTSFFRALLGLIEIAGGEVRVNGQSPRRGRVQIGYVPQNNPYDARFPLRAGEVVAMGCLGPASLWQRALIWKSRASQRAVEARAVQETLARVGLADAVNEPIRTLSGGQLQRVFIARALVSRPALLILDEPTTYLDAEATAQLYALLGEWNRAGQSILMSSHDPEPAAGLANRAFELKGGTLREVGGAQNAAGTEDTGGILS